MPAAKTVKPFANLHTAIDALGALDINTDIQNAADDIETCESVETLADFAANLASARGQLETALAAIIKLQARCI
jgi:hypothetical protein